MKNSRIATRFFALVSMGLLAPGALAQPTPNSAPTLRVPPKIEVASPMALFESRLQKLSEQMNALQKENDALKKQLAQLQAQKSDNDKLAGRVAQLEKDGLSLKLIVPALDKAFSEHTHETRYSYSTLEALLAQPNSNKVNFYIPYVWLGGGGHNRPLSEKIKDVKPHLGKTTPPGK